MHHFETEDFFDSVGYVLDSRITKLQYFLTFGANKMIVLFVTKTLPSAADGGPGPRAPRPPRLDVSPGHGHALRPIRHPGPRRRKSLSPFSYLHP
mgnify:CR=1 FL=1